MSRQDDLKSQIIILHRTLQKLQEQKAAFGLDTRPHILIEIEDKQAEIETLQEELLTLEAITRSNPYRGLSAFREQDADFFFGRESFTTQLVESVRHKPLVAVFGPSGSGKSSIVFAGLLPHLRREGGWIIADFRPKDDPFRALAAALLPLYETGLDQTDQMVKVPKLAAYLREREITLADVVTKVLQISVSSPHPSSPPRFLLIADQFEELYTLCPDSETRHGFLDTLLFAPSPPPNPRPSTPLTLVLTLRADFLGQALAYRPFADALCEADVKLGPMTPEELRQAIEKPAQTQGVTFEPGLVERILIDVGSEPGNLPLLEFALTALWEQQTRGELTHATYDSIGRVEGALSRHADQVLARLSTAEQEQAQRVFTQLIQPGEGTEDTRRLAHRDELAEADWALVQELANQRLVVTNQDPNEQETVEIVHEALIQNWTQLRGWMQEDRRFRVWQERLRMALHQWKNSQEDESALLRGVLLSEAEIWLSEREGNLGQAERNFIRASVISREREIAEQEAQRRRELKAAQHFRWLAIALGSALLLVGLLWIRSWWSINCLEFGLSTGLGIYCQEIRLLKMNLFRADLSGADLIGINLIEASLSGADLIGADMNEADLRGANLDGAYMSKAFLNQTDLSGANLSGADLSGADLRGAKLNKARLNGANLSGANLSGASLSQANLNQANLSQTILSEAVLSQATLIEVNLSQAILIEATLSQAFLSGANLREANLRGADLSQTDLFKTNLVKANLSQADLYGADITGSNLSQAILFRATLFKVNLSQATLIEANLSRAFLSQANLSQADLTQTVLIEINLSEANLSGTNLSEADMSQALLAKALYTKNTTWPNGFDPEEAGAVKTD
jgi:uncharacterized protein YjbI with pentapeptide repeats